MTPPMHAKGLPCEERRRLSDLVIASIDLVHRVRDDVDTPNGPTKAAALSKAREQQRIALRNLREHIAQHGCRM
jgi:hypothetical protein